MRSTAALLLLLLALCNCCSSTHGSKVIVLTDDNFDELTSEGSWLIEGFNQWCPPCRELAPVWERLAEELEGEVYVGKFDVEKQRVLPRRFGVLEVPAIFYLTGSQTYQYPHPPEGKRTFKAILQFARGGWREIAPSPFFRAPTSTFGRVYGAGLMLPSKASTAYTFLSKEKGYSDLTLLVLLLAVPVSFGLAAICALDAYYTRRPAFQAATQAHVHQE